MEILFTREDLEDLSRSKFIDLVFYQQDQIQFFGKQVESLQETVKQQQETINQYVTG